MHCLSGSICQMITLNVYGCYDYRCTVCLKLFASAYILKRHQLVHTGERPYQCDLCSQTFNQSSALKTHKKGVHKINLIKKKQHLTLTLPDDPNTNTQLVTNSQSQLPNQQLVQVAHPLTTTSNDHNSLIHQPTANLQISAGAETAETPQPSIIPSQHLQTLPPAQILISHSQPSHSEPLPQAVSLSMAPPHPPLQQITIIQDSHGQTPLLTELEKSTSVLWARTMDHTL